MFADESEKVLKDQACRGQVPILAEEEARRRYCDQLTSASLGTLAKGRTSEGYVGVRIILDGNTRNLAQLHQQCVGWRSVPGLV